MEELRYSGNWEISGKEYFGNLIINDKKGINRLILHNKDKTENLFSDTEIKIYSKDTYKDDYKEPKLRGMLFSLTDIMNNNVQLLTNWKCKTKINCKIKVKK